VDIKEYAKSIENRLLQEVAKCQSIFQLLNETFRTDRLYQIETAKPFFNTIYIIMVDYLCIHIIKLFDPAKSGKNKNFSIAYIEENIPSIKQIDKNARSLECVKKYRNKYLAHCDISTDRAVSASYKVLKFALSRLLRTLHNVRQEVADTIHHNDDKHCLQQEIILDRRYSGFNELVYYGSYIVANKKNPNTCPFEISNMNDTVRNWHKEQREK